MLHYREFSLKYYWNLQEVVAEFTGESLLDHEPYEYGTNENYFSDVFYGGFQNAPIWKSANVAKDHIEDLWQLVFARFYKEYCFGTDEDELTENEAKEFLVKLINIIVMTYPKYAALLDYYKAKEGSLLDQINSVTTGLARFNDTPQNEEADDEFEGDLHVTNLTKTKGTSATDGMSPIERLKQIQDSYKLVLRDWSDEFKKIFIEGGNITL